MLSLPGKSANGINGAAAQAIISVSQGKAQEVKKEHMEWQSAEKMRPEAEDFASACAPNADDSDIAGFSRLALGLAHCGQRDSPLMMMRMLVMA